MDLTAVHLVCGGGGGGRGIKMYTVTILFSASCFLSAGPSCLLQPSAGPQWSTPVPVQLHLSAQEGQARRRVIEGKGECG